MASLRDLIDHLDALLEPASFADYGPNGLQVPGREEVEVVVTGVSATAELFERAAQAGADLVLTHHGLFWEGSPRALDRPARRRLKLLFDAEMSLAAYHLPLDGHPEVGNNALIAAGLGCESWGPFALHRGRAIGVAGRFPGAGISREDLVARVRELGGPWRSSTGRRRCGGSASSPVPARAISPTPSRPATTRFSRASRRSG